MPFALPAWRPSWWPKWSYRTWCVAGVLWKVVATAVLLLFAAHGNRSKDSVSVCGPVPRAVAAQYTDLVSYPLRTPDIAANVAVVRPVADGRGVGRFEILLCNRSRPPALLALPGGYVEVGEATEVAALRELREETGLDVPAAVGGQPGGREMAMPLAARLVGGASALGGGQVGSFQLFSVNSASMRDQRRHTVELSYLLNLLPDSPLSKQRPRGADDVGHCAYWGVDEVVALERQAIAARGRSLFAFDHGRQVGDVLAAMSRSSRPPASSSNT